MIISNRNEGLARDREVLEERRRKQIEDGLAVDELIESEMQREFEDDIIQNYGNDKETDKGSDKSK